MVPCIIYNVTYSHEYYLSSNEHDLNALALALESFRRFIREREESGLCVFGLVGGCVVGCVCVCLCVCVRVFGCVKTDSHRYERSNEVLKVYQPAADDLS